jgi:hypothetical protein
MVNQNLLNFLHMSNAFGQNPSPAAPFIQPQIPQAAPLQEMPVADIPDEPMPYDPQADLDSFVPQTRMSQEFNENLNSRPNEDTYKAPLLRKILGIVAGTVEGYNKKSPAAGFDTAHGIINQPIHDKMEDWKSRQDLLTKATQMEDVNNRAAQTAKLSEVQKKLLAQGQTDLRLKNERGNKVAEAKLALANFIANKPHIDMVKGDKFWMAHDTTTNKLISTGIPTGLMTDAEIQQAITNRTAMQQGGANYRQRVAGEQAIDLATKKGKIAKDVKVAPSKPPLDPNATNSQIKIARDSEIAAIMQKYPGAFITDKDKKTKLKQKGTIVTGNNAAIDAAAKELEAVNQKYPMQPPTNRFATPPNATTSKPDPLGIRK